MMSKITVLINHVFRRSISLSRPFEGKRNFKKFMLINKRGTVIHKKQQAGDNPVLPVDTRGVRPTGHRINGRFVTFPEMIPELIVPNLAGCELKPYVSYKAPDVVQSEFTPEQLFNVVYGEKIISDFKEGKVDDMGNPKEPSINEKLTPEEAFMRARKTGSDIFFEVLSKPKPTDVN